MVPGKVWKTLHKYACMPKAGKHLYLIGNTEKPSLSATTWHI